MALVIKGKGSGSTTPSKRDDTPAVKSISLSSEGTPPEKAAAPTETKKKLKLTWRDPLQSMPEFTNTASVPVAKQDVPPARRATGPEAAQVKAPSNAPTSAGPKKLVIKSPPKPEKPSEAPDKEPETQEAPTFVPVKASAPLSKLTQCTFCGFMRTDPCNGSSEPRGSFSKEGEPLQCADKRLVERLRKEGLDHYGKPVRKTSLKMKVKA